METMSLQNVGGQTKCIMVFLKVSHSNAFFSDSIFRCKIPL